MGKSSKTAEPATVPYITYQGIADRRILTVNGEELTFNKGDQVAVSQELLEILQTQAPGEFEVALIKQSAIEGDGDSAQEPAEDTSNRLDLGI